MDSRITHYSDFILTRRIVSDPESGINENQMEVISARDATQEKLEGLSYIRTCQMKGQSFDEWGDEKTVLWYKSCNNL